MAGVVRVAMVGLGRIAHRAHLPALSAMDGVSITAACDADEDTLRQVAAAYGIPHAYTDARSMVNGASFDCALVLTRPHDTHAWISRLLLEHGKDVLCEKPMALVLDDARALVDLARDRGLIYTVAFNRRIMPVVTAARALFAGRRIRQCVTTHATVGPRTNVLLDNPHAVDLLRYFVDDAKDGTPRLVYAVNDAPASPTPSVSAVIEFGSGGAGVLILTHHAGAAAERVDLYGDGLSVSVDITAHSLRYAAAGGAGDGGDSPWQEQHPDPAATFERLHGFESLDTHFIECVRSRAQPRFSAADAYRSHELVHALHREIQRSVGGDAGGHVPKRSNL